MKTISELAFDIQDYLSGEGDIEAPGWVKALPEPYKSFLVSELNKASEGIRNTERAMEEVLWRWRVVAQFFIDPGLAQRLGLSLDESKESPCGL